MAQALSPTQSADRGAFAPLVAIILSVVGAVSLIAYFAASAYAPDLRSLGDTRTNALSRSAVGFGGLVSFLEAMDVPVLISRGLGVEAISDASLYVVTPSITHDSLDIDELEGAYFVPTLVILPKWQALPQSGETARVTKGGLVQSGPLTERFLDPYTEGSVLQRRDTESNLRPMHERFKGALSPGAIEIESLQSVASGEWSALVTDAAGNGVLLNINESNLFVLTDPDLMNTHGLADIGTARVTAGIIDALREGDGPVVFDVTLYGYSRSPNFLRLIFEPPMLGATICVLLTALLMGFHAANRFGAPKRTERVFAFGKRALADNSAALVGMLRREHRMAGRYALVTRNAAMRAVGISPELDQEERDELLENIRKQGGKGDTLSDLIGKARTVSDRRGVVWIARRLYRWRQGIEHGSRSG